MTAFLNYCFDQLRNPFRLISPAIPYGMSRVSNFYKNHLSLWISNINKILTFELKNGNRFSIQRCKALSA